MPHRFLALLFLAGLLLQACGTKQPPQVIVVKVEGGYSGTIHIQPCKKSEPDLVIADGQGYGQTSLCPSREVELSVIRDHDTIRISPDSVTVLATADGTPRDIVATLQ